MQTQYNLYTIKSISQNILSIFSTPADSTDDLFNQLTDSIAKHLTVTLNDNINNKITQMFQSEYDYENDSSLVNNEKHFFKQIKLMSDLYKERSDKLSDMFYSDLINSISQHCNILERHKLDEFFSIVKTGDINSAQKKLETIRLNCEQKILSDKNLRFKVIDEICIRLIYRKDQDKEYELYFMNFLKENKSFIIDNISNLSENTVTNIRSLSEDIKYDSLLKNVFLKHILLPVYSALHKVNLISSEDINNLENRITINTIQRSCNQLQ